METLKAVVANHLASRKYSIVIDGKVYSSQQLAEEVLKETEIGVKVLQIVIKGTLERYSKTG